MGVEQVFEVNLASYGDRLDVGVFQRVLAEVHGVVSGSVVDTGGGLTLLLSVRNLGRRDVARLVSRAVAGSLLAGDVPVSDATFDYLVDVELDRWDELLNLLAKGPVG